MPNKVIIEVRINEYAMRDQNPNVPYSPEETSSQALECWREGASIIHYHARDPKTGAPASDAKLYADTVRRIKEKSDVITMPTLGAWWLPSVEARIAHIVEMAKDPMTKPDFGPIDMATGNVDTYDPKGKRFKTNETVYMNTTKTWQYFAETMKSVGVKPIQALWNVPSIRATQAFVDMGIFTEPVYCEIVLTEDWLLSGHPGTVKGMQAFLDFLPQHQKWQWSVMCVGGNLFPLVAAAIERGGHISIGLGDYPYPELERPTNARLVARVAQIAREMGREVATPKEAREMLGLK
ncbi:MAG: 3-keto-5-aminohexanoate cleavage protein [Deltaproteobacteria bacterium]|nr:3-keto-5-aminohexanoate cleavage protein [Deltaproteobacteria bacterium]